MLNNLYIFDLCLNRIWYWITNKGWYAIKSTQPNLASCAYFSVSIEFLSTPLFYLPPLFSDSVALYGWPAKQTIPSSVLARNQTKRIFGSEISPYPEAVRGRERELVGQRSWEAVGDGTAGKRVSRRVGVEPRTDAVDSRDSSREDRVQRRRLSQDVGIPVALWNFR